MSYAAWRRFELARLATFIAVALIVTLAAGCSGKGTLHSAATVAATVADASGATPPAPAEATEIDEKLLSLSARAVTVAAKASSALFKGGVIARGSPTALQLARWLDIARDSILAAENARQALSAASYREALARADAAVAAIMALISPFGA